ncbi:hypothetical protein M433DRAFT_156570 [Acidomyces richmondensis BFW]|nr:MAG: hypothetical protein FE78DRAFT_93829 [Acidomyces sp. 'richmondensis']KYG43571.1 hypothetical protein M433DRAFT_156570 [Acidomyces richmondensis BFW]
MCGRYVLSLPPSQIRRRLADQNMPASSAPDDNNDQIRQTYNFAPGYHGLIYRADITDPDSHPRPMTDMEDGEPSPKKAKLTVESSVSAAVDGHMTKETQYKLQAAKWGLIPSWTKRAPDYISQLRTINCRDDSLAEDRGMWNGIKRRKRCIVIAEGFYEWLKKAGGKEKIPHYVRRADGQLMCMAGLWDAVRYDGSEDLVWTYTIVTTEANQRLRFLHDRMPVILEAGSEEMRKWLDPGRVGWDAELQEMLQPFAGALDVFPVDKAVGKVGNNNPNFVVPVDSLENKRSIANFFGKQMQGALKESAGLKQMEADGDKMSMGKMSDPETNAPLPKSDGAADDELKRKISQDMKALSDNSLDPAAEKVEEHFVKRGTSEISSKAILRAASVEAPPPAPKKVDMELSSGTVNKIRMRSNLSPIKGQEKPPGNMRSSTSNANTIKTPTTKGGNQRITSFFGK